MENPSRPAALQSPDKFIRPTPPLLDKEYGGVALNDGAQGMLVKVWVAELVGNDVRIYPENDPGSFIVAFSEANISGISLTFDQNMNWAVAYEVPGSCKLSWYDTSLPGRVVLTISGGRSPFMSMDDKRAFATTISSNDMLFYYIRGNTVYYRQQADTFLIERALRTFVGPNISIRRAGMTVGPNLRMVVEVSGVDNRV
jgi:hypothetical protein